MNMSAPANHKSKKIVVVVGRNYGNILSMTRALGRAGYDVDILRLHKTKPNPINLISTMKPDAFSKYVRNYNECIIDSDTNKPIDMLISMASDESIQLLIPVDDYSCGIIDESINALKSWYILPKILGKSGGIKQMMDKDAQKKIAEEVGLPILKSVLIKSENRVYEIPDGVIFPCFIKPNISMNGNKARMAKCDDREQLDRILSKYAANGDFELLVEEYADIKNEYSLLGISDGQTVFAPGLFRTEIGGHRERKGVAMTGVTEDTHRFSQFVKKCEEYIRHLGFIGLFDIDIVETSAGDIYFIEMNFRAGASVHVFTELGVNMPGIFADNMIKRIPISTEVPKCQGGKRFLSEKIMLEEFARNDISRRKMKKHLNSANILFINDTDDPKPYNIFKKYYFIAWIMRLPYRLRDRRRNNVR